MKRTALLPHPTTPHFNPAVLLPKRPSGSGLRRCLLAVGLGLSLPLAILTPIHAQPVTDDFNDGNDNGWTHYDPLSGPVGAPMASFNVVSGAYRIQAAASPMPNPLGPGRAAGLRATPSYTDFYVTADVVAWNTNINQAFGLLARVNSPGLGTTMGYAFTYQEVDHDISIARIVGEAGSDISGSAKEFTLDPTKRYRFAFVGTGAKLEGRVYELPDLRNPIITTTINDSSYASGISGLLVYDNSSASTGTADATFDNYFALDVEPPWLAIEVADFGDMKLSWSAEATGFLLQYSAVLPGTNWVTIPAEAVTIQNGRATYTVPSPGGNNFFRLRKP